MDTGNSTLIHKMEAEGPFSALGFYEIQRSTLTSMFSTIITYLVIMVQFSTANEPRTNYPIQNITNIVDEKSV